MSEVKVELKEIVDFFINKDKYTKVGSKLPKGLLLTGSPGTGKTYISKAIASESKCNFYYVSGSEFIQKFIGKGAKLIRDLFDEAKSNQPAIIFIDEIDSVGKKRSENLFGNDE